MDILDEMLLKDWSPADVVRFRLLVLLLCILDVDVLEVDTDAKSASLLSRISSMDVVEARNCEEM